MTSKQLNKQGMLITFEEYVDSQLAVTSSIPRFLDAYGRVKSANLTIQQLRLIQEGDKTGTTKGKKQLREKVIVETAYLSSKLIACASIQDDASLLAEVTYSEAELKKVPDIRLKDIAELLHQHAVPHLADLAEFDVTTDSLATFKALIQSYLIAIPKQKRSVNDRAEATQQIAVLFDAIDGDLDLLDKLVNANQQKYPDFYNGYYRARKILHLGKQSLTLQAVARDTTGNPLPNVIFEIIQGTGNVANARLGEEKSLLPKPVIVKKTGAKGNIKVKSLSDGTYSAIVKKLGYQERSLTFHVVAGELVSLDVQLENE